MQLLRHSLEQCGASVQDFPLATSEDAVTDSDILE